MISPLIVHYQVRNITANYFIYINAKKRHWVVCVINSPKNREDM